MSTLFFIKKGTFNHCGRSNDSNSTHHGRSCSRLRIQIQILIHVHIHVHMHIRVRVCLCFFFLLCGAVGGGVGWVGWSGVCRGVVWCGVSGAKVAEQIV